MLKGLKGIDECSKGKYSLNGERNVSKSTHNLKKSHGMSKQRLGRNKMYWKI